MMCKTDFRRRGIFWAIWLSVFTTSLHAQLQTSLHIRPGMVIQRSHEIPLWGTSNPGSRIFVALNGVTDSTLTLASGDWEIRLPAMVEGGPYELSIHTGSDSLRYDNVYIGDVWLASGQSNMEFRLRDSDNADQEISGTDNPEIRQFLVTKTLGNTPSENIPAGSAWTPATPQYAGDFSAVGYYFAKNLYAHLGIPVGIINTSYGGTTIEAWMSESMLGFDEENIVFGEGQGYLQPTVAYNRMLHPLTRIPIKGFLWYQGESNMGSRESAMMYSVQLKKLITSWRTLWGFGDLPFLWVQIPNTGTEANEINPGTWDALPLLRDAQSRVRSLPVTGEAVTIDTGEPDIHPTNQAPFGERLALVARSVAYGDTVIHSGPRYLSHQVLGNGKIAISFNNSGSGLLARESMDSTLRWFSVVAPNGTRYPANAVIESNRVEVWNNSIPNPTEVRYAWESNPFNINFYNNELLPAAPFKFFVNPPGFKVDFFNCTETYIRKGESAIITWQVFGADSARINNLPVDTIGGWRIWPKSDSLFTLKIRNRSLPDQEKSVSLLIHVQQPDPTIQIGSDAGAWISTGTEVNLHADANAPDGGTITLVRFFVNGVVVDSLLKAPYETVWIPDSTGYYQITGIATNQVGLTATSDTLKMEVLNLQKSRYEAEEATLAGGKYILDNELVSGGSYVQLTRDWTITFSDIGLPKDSWCQLTIGFRLNYGSPRVQKLMINGESYGTLIFESADEDSWEKYHLLAQLQEGTNQLAIEADWGYMSLDYIDLEVEADTNQTTMVNDHNGELALDPVYPNPFSQSIHVSFDLPSAGETTLEILDLSGRVAATILNQVLDGGSHQFSYDSDLLAEGIYFLKLTFMYESRMMKMLKFSH